MWTFDEQDKECEGVRAQHNVREGRPCQWAAGRKARQRWSPASPALASPRTASLAPEFI